MPNQPNRLARILIPIALLAIGLIAPIAIIKGGSKPRAAAAQPTPTETIPTQPAQDADPPADAPPSVQAQPPTPAPDPALQDPGAQASPPPPAQYVAETFAADPLAAGFAPIGSLDPASGHEAYVEFSHIGAGVRALRLTNTFDSWRADRDAAKKPVAPERHVAVQEEAVYQNSIIVPLAALAIEIDATPVPLTIRNDSSVWRQVAPDSPGRFEAFILDAAGQRVLRLERAYSVAPGSRVLRLDQRVENLSSTPHTIRLRHFGPVDMAEDALGYGGDKRRLRFAYLYDAQFDPARQTVGADDFLIPRVNAVNPKNAPTLWPNKTSQKRRYDLAWVGLTSRYFGAVILPVIDPAAPAPDKRLSAVESVERALLPGGDRTLALSLVAPQQSLAPGASHAYSLAMYAGPLSTSVIDGEPMLASMGVAQAVVFNFGGMCGFCTFTWLTQPLLALMRALHWLTSDWSLAIILLVVCVRSILHPLTRWSQIRMQRFARQMQALGPKQKVIQERYKDDRKKMQEEMGRLWREEGVSPAGFLGCLPIFLQSPVWIALYATLYFAIELRHEHAFFGLFQTLTANSWGFLADLAEPDHAISFGGAGFTIPLMGRIASLNILPLLLGVVFWVHQKYLTPPSATPLTPEQEDQQKMMRVISVVMFPIFMYNAPCGLSLYFITNSTLAIFESRWIRRHIEKHKLLEPDKLRKQPKPGSFMARLRDAAAQAREAQQARAQGSPKGPQTPRRGRDEPRRHFKNR